MTTPVILTDVTPVNPYERIHEMVGMQYDLSFALAGDNWLFDPMVDTTSAMMQESNELIESAGYKPWWSKSDVQTDLENCKTEVVDLFHFLMQGCLQETARALEANPVERNDNPRLVVEIVGDRFYKALTEYLDQGPLSNGRNDVQLVQHWLAHVLVTGEPLCSLRHFWEMAFRFGVHFNDLYGRYFAKNTLNRFRRMANYKGDKTDLPPYVKLWDGTHEDNWHVLRYVEFSRGDVPDLVEVMSMLYYHYTGIMVTDVDEEKLNWLSRNYMEQLRQQKAQ